MDRCIAEEVWSIDTEWGFRDDQVDHESSWEPVVLCAVGLRSGRRFHFWGRDDRLSSFLLEHGNDLFVAHNVVAEMKYLLRLDVPLPAKWFDTFVAWRFITNKPNHLEAGLSKALHCLGVPHMAPAAKEQLQQRILHLQFAPESQEDRDEIIDYCFTDCDGAAILYARTCEQVRFVIMAHWCEYLKAVARMELRGIPFDVEGYQQILRQQPSIRSSLIADINKTAPIFVDGSFKANFFLTWRRNEGIQWPVRESGATGKAYYPLDDETFKDMEGRHPFIGRVRQVRKTLNTFGQRVLVVDPVTRRHYFSTSAFRSVTGRNQPKNFVFSGPKWFRYLIVPESPDHTLVYVDYSAQEIGIAAALSGDANMQAVYEASDCHLAFAIRAGAAPADATKQSHPNVRKSYKTVNLGVQYGQTAFGISAKLGIPIQEAEALLTQHKELFATFWAWSERIVQGAIDRGQIVTPCGWRSRVPPFHKDRSWLNWPMQATGGDIMRLTITYLDRQNVRVLAPVHDGFLLSCRRDQLEDLRAAVDYACSTAVEHVLPGFPLRWDFTVYDNGRFEDDDGLSLWTTLQTTLREQGHAAPA
jgi:DNA polymerase-1